MKVILNVVLWKYISDGNCDYFKLLLSEVPNYNRAKSSSCVNHGNDETLNQKALILRGKHNWIGFRLGIEGFYVLASSLS